MKQILDDIISHPITGVLIIFLGVIALVVTVISIACL